MRAAGAIVLLALAVGGSHAPGQRPQPGAVAGDPVRWRVLPVEAVPRTAPAEVRVPVRATVAVGWHLYALDEPDGGPAPLEFRLPAGSAVALVSVGAEPPQRGTLPGNAASVLFYSGSAAFRLRLRRSAAAIAQPEEVPLEVRYQACNDRMCLPPRAVILRLTLPGR